MRRVISRREARPWEDHDMIKWRTLGGSSLVERRAFGKPFLLKTSTREKLTLVERKRAMGVDIAR